MPLPRFEVRPQALQPTVAMTVLHIELSLTAQNVKPSSFHDVLLFYKSLQLILLCVLGLPIGLFPFILKCVVFS